VATEQRVEVITQLAGADLSAKQYQAVKPNGTDNTVVIAASQGETILGILQDKPAAAGRAAAVAVGGVCKWLYGDTINAGDKLTVGADARAEVALTGDHVVARALVDGVDGDIGSVLFGQAEQVGLS